MKRAYSVEDILRKRHKTILFTGEFFDAYGEVDRVGMWFIWGGSGSGKSSFAMQLCKELCKHGTVLYNSREEGVSLTFQDRIERYNMREVKHRFKVVDEDMETFCNRLTKPKSPDFCIIDSWQYCGITFKQYRELRERFPNKLFIFVSHADGKQPAGRPAKQMMYEATMKIYVEGHRATSKGRFFGKDKDYFDSWPEKAKLYHSKK